MCWWWRCGWEHSLLLNSFAYSGDCSDKISLQLDDLLVYTKKNSYKHEAFQPSSSRRLEFWFFDLLCTFQKNSTMLQFGALMLLNKLRTCCNYAVSTFHYTMSFNTLTSLQPQHKKISMTRLSKTPVTTIPLQISTHEVQVQWSISDQTVAKVATRQCSFFSTYFEGYWPQLSLIRSCLPSNKTWQWLYFRTMKKKKGFTTCLIIGFFQLWWSLATLNISTLS
jgi:hypothetical protein